MNHGDPKIGLPKSMDIAACSDLRFRAHPYCGNQRGGLLKKTGNDKNALTKCKNKWEEERKRKEEKKEFCLKHKYDFNCIVRTAEDEP